jgi:hypothetical protein
VGVVGPLLPTALAISQKSAANKSKIYYQPTEQTLQAQHIFSFLREHVHISTNSYFECTDLISFISKKEVPILYKTKENSHEMVE